MQQVFTLLFKALFTNKLLAPMIFKLSKLFFLVLNFYLPTPPLLLVILVNNTIYIIINNKNNIKNLNNNKKYLFYFS